MKINKLLRFDKSQKSVQNFGILIAGIVFAMGVYSVIIHHSEIRGIGTLSIGIVLISLFFQKPLLILYYPIMVIVQLVKLGYRAIVSAPIEDSK